MPAPATANEVDTILERFDRVRSFSRTICEPLETEDYVVQSMPDVSPTRWHLAHTTWFFETFVLKPNWAGYRSSNDAFDYLFNSYYNTVGKQYPRARRGLLSRPTVKDVWSYREAVNQGMAELMSSALPTNVTDVIELGLQHEQQHQELMLTDIKHVLSCNPLLPSYSTEPKAEHVLSSRANWLSFAGGVGAFGFDGNGFCFDNECPRHEALLHDYSLQDRLVTNGEYLDFMLDGGYSRPDHWLSLGWGTIEKEKWEAPLYWRKREGAWHEFTLNGLKPLSMYAPVCHVSYFEADAYARWAGCRLPTELEWEGAVSSQEANGNFADSMRFQPMVAPSKDQPRLRQVFGDVWEWTASQYGAYPGYRPPEGALGEYNGKFMCNQFVLRGGSCATSQSHIRPSYRNFFPPEARWQFSGIRLAKTGTAS